MQILLYVFLFLVVIALIFFTVKLLNVFEKKNTKFDFFIKNIEIYMKRVHPNIGINYSIVELVKNEKNEKNEKIKETLVIQDIVSQFYNFNFTKKTQKTIPKEKLWATYIDNPLSSSYPNDWLQRKEFAYVRDNISCKRCGQNLESLNEVYTSFVRPVKEGGGYNFENILTLCADCSKIMDSNLEKSSIISSLKLYDNLLKFIED